MSSKYRDEVVAVGALGGSGTRAVAQLLIEAGIYLGAPLYATNDNLAFTAIFKNPDWFKRAKAPEIERRMQIFESLMRTDRISPQDFEALNWKPGMEKVGSPEGNSEYPLHLLQSLVENTPLIQPRHRWGWKEPNTHIFLRQLSTYFPNLKYVHVLRHGLDMAFARNKKQLFNWGYLFDLEASPEEDESSLAQKQLEFWIRSSKTAIETGKEFLGDRFHLLRYEDICTRPGPEIKKLMGFLGIDISERLGELENIFQLSEGHGRYREKDLGIFSKAQLSAVKALGYAV